jgi:hypothetical protein
VSFVSAKSKHEKKNGKKARLFSNLHKEKKLLLIISNFVKLVKLICCITKCVYTDIKINAYKFYIVSIWLHPNGPAAVVALITKHPFLFFCFRTLLFCFLSAFSAAIYICKRRSARRAALLFLSLALPKSSETNLGPNAGN